MRRVRANNILAHISPTHTSQVLGSLQVTAKSLDRMKKEITFFEKTLAEQLKKSGKELQDKAAALVQRYTGGNQLASRLLGQALSITTTYQVSVGGVTASLDLCKLAASCSRQQLIKDENDLHYLLSKLEKVEDAQITPLAWRDVAETWSSLISLRAQMKGERVQVIIDCIVSDKRLLKALGARRVSHTLPTVAVASGPGAMKA